MGILDKMLGRDDDKDENKAGTVGKPTFNTTSDTPMADFSDVQGTSSSAQVADERTYTVQSGDSLSKIAQREYGNAGDWQRIYEANRGLISNPDLIHPGQVLTIPADR